MIGQTLGHYRVEAKLGEGGMGVVYRAMDTRLDRPVALKVLPAESVADPERKRRFVQEAKAASALNHPNIITIYDIDTAGGVDFIAMEYVPGKTLGQLLPRKGLRLSELLRHAIPIADALAAAHAAGIVHRDLKPANVMVSDQGIVKVLDFGLAKLVEKPEADELDPTLDEGLRTQEGTILGTAAYMSPEQAEGRPVDARSDVFSFGAVLYEMTTGRRPFQGETKISTLSAILHQEPKPISEIAEGAPRDLEKIIARCLRKERERRFQHIDDVKVALEELKEESESGKLTATLPVARPARRRTLAVSLAAVAVLAGVAAVVVWWLSRSSQPHLPATLVRLTSDSGLTMTPALSPDGKLIAYASDRSGEGSLDIWVQQVGGGEAIRLTRDATDDYDPSFSSDGRRIAFRSEREGGGIYVISALGGEARKIAPLGRRPRFSPDGNWIVYFTGTVSPGTGGIYVAPSAGGPARQLRADFSAGAYPIWTPDGKHLLFLGRDRTESGLEWWVTPIEAGKAVNTGALAVFGAQGLALSAPDAWMPQGGGVLASAAMGDTRNVWQVPISPKTWKASSVPRRLTFGTTLEVQPSIGASNQVAFSSLNENIDIWGLPADANQGKAAGGLQRLTEDAAADIRPSVSPDGKKLAFISRRSGNWEVWLKDLVTGKDTAVTATTVNDAFANFSPDGSKLAYVTNENQKATVYLVSLAGGGIDKVCEACGGNLGWSSDGKRLLFLGRTPARISFLDLASGRRTGLLENATYTLWQPRFSPDDRWVSFNGTGAGRSRIFIAPVRGQGLIPESEWIAITDGPRDDKPRWSPDGNALYFTSERDGFRCIWAQRLEPSAKRPVGPPTPIFHAHEARRSLMNVGIGILEIAVARDKVVFNMGERTGNIWMVQSGR